MKMSERKITSFSQKHAIFGPSAQSHRWLCSFAVRPESGAPLRPWRIYFLRNDA